MIDRFGLLPDAAKNLVALTQCKQKAQALGIKRIEMHNKGGSVEFAERTKVQPGYIIKLIQTQSRIYKLEGGNKLKFTMELPGASERLALLKTMLADFKTNSQ